MLNSLRRVAGEKKAAMELYRIIAERSREQVFYAALGVADTFDGRFDLIVLHSWMVMDALRRTGFATLEQHLIRIIFTGFEDGLREQGAGDMSIGRRAKAMTSAMFGRVRSYEAAADEGEMAIALLRNLFRDAASRADCASRIAHYISDSRKRLAAAALDEGVAEFAPLPDAPEKPD